MAVPIKIVSLLDKEKYQEAADTGLMETAYSPYGDFAAHEAIESLYFSSSPQEKLVLEYTLGLHGKERLSSVKKISDKTGMTVYQVRAAKESLKKQLEKHVGQLSLKV